MWSLFQAHTATHELSDGCESSIAAVVKILFYPLKTERCYAGLIPVMTAGGQRCGSFARNIAAARGRFYLCLIDGTDYGIGMPLPSTSGRSGRRKKDEGKLGDPQSLS